MYHTTGFAKDEIIDLCAPGYMQMKRTLTPIRGRSLSVFTSQWL